MSIKDFFVEAPIKQPIDANIANLVRDTPEVRAEIEQALLILLRRG